MTKLEPRIIQLEGRVAEMDKNSAVAGELINQFSSNLEKFFTSIEKLDNTLNSVQLTMVEMQSEIKNQGEKISKLETKVDCIDGESKFNWRKFVGEKVIPYLIVAGITYALIQLPSLLAH